MSEPRRHVPTPTPETVHFWAGTARGELLLQRCTDCAHVRFPPRAFCPACHSRSGEIIASSGRATLHSYVIAERGVPWLPAPYVIAIVELEEGPRMMTNIVGCPPEPDALPLDLALQVRFEPVGDGISLPLFAPAEAS